jgi:hypothetical protein
LCSKTGRRANRSRSDRKKLRLDVVQVHLNCEGTQNKTSENMAIGACRTAESRRIAEVTLGGLTEKRGKPSGKWRCSR